MKEEKKTKNSKGNSRLAKMQSITTKDSNEMENLSIDQSIRIEETKTVTKTVSGVVPLDMNIEAMMDESESDSELYSASVDDIPRSRTIDNNMLSKERLSKGVNKPGLTKDFSRADRFYPNSDTGLNFMQVDRRVEEGFTNYTKKKTAKTYKSIIFGNCFTIINAICVVVALALMFTGAELSQLFFLVIILVNTGIGIVQEIRSKITVEKLSLITAPTATVVRNGEKVVIPVNEVVLDDVLFLEVGKQVCADAIVIKGEAEANESMLTGESDAVKKAVGAELYSGSFISSGNCFARVDKVGSANYAEKLTSHAKKYKKPKSELFTAVQLIMKIVIPLAIIIAILSIINYYIGRPAGDKEWADNIQRAAAVTIGMLPTGMFLLTSTALMVSVMRLSKRKTLVQDLYCIEMLARVNVLCLDKTGTITDGSMQVKEVDELMALPTTEYNYKDIIGSMLTATGDNNQTARALSDYFGLSKKLSPTVVMPFSSQRKLAGVTFEHQGTYIYGAPEFILKEVSAKLDKKINEYASSGYRVLCLAYSPTPINKDKVPTNAKALCLIAIEDHIRDDAVETIKWFKENSVEVKVISGDNPITVAEVAKRVGVENASSYISLDGLSNQEVVEAANKYTVFGRVTPEQKKILVRSIKAKGNTVAMTGDGVNDILAMREADCAVSIASGAEATRNVAHLVLLDSNFTSMPQVVLEGRRVVNNIQQSSALFLMKTFMTVILAIISLVMRTDYPYKTNTLLLLEICVIAASSFALALQQNKNLIKGNFLSNVIGSSLPGGITLAGATIAVYLYSQNYLVDVSNMADIYQTMLALNVTFVGYMILVKICEPANGYRVVLLSVIMGLLLVFMFALPTVFGISAVLGTQDLFYLIVVVLGSYFVATVLIKILKSTKVIQ